MKPLAFLLFFFHFLYGDVWITDAMQNIENFELHYYYDLNKTKTIEEIQHIEFKDTTPNMFTFGFITGNSWFKLTIHNKSQNTQFIFQLIEPFFQRINFYIQKNGIWHQEHSGLKQYAVTHNPKYLSPIFPFEIQPHSSKTIYIEFAPDKATAGSSFGRFVLATQPYFNTQSLLGNYEFYFFFLGTMFIIVLFNLFMFIKFRDIIYFYYALYIVFLSTYVSIYTGLIHHFGLALWYRELSLSMPIFVAFLILFSDRFLKLKHYLPNMHKFFMVVSTFLILSLPYMLYDYSSWMKTIGVSTILIAPIATFTAIYVVYQGHKEAKYYIIGMIFYIASLTVLPLMTKAIIPHNFWTHYAFSAFSYIEILFFSFVLINRFYTIQNDKIKLQSELLDIQKNNEKILERRVEKRTNKINQLLNEKEVLLKEVYHRVKNNFQMVIGLLWIQNENRNNKNDDNSLLELINRIKSMSLIHEYLLGMDDYTEIKSQKYLHQINLEIEKSYTQKALIIHDNIDNFTLLADQALALGVIVNELLTNAVKHHHSSDICHIQMQCQKVNHKVTLTIQDNGKGFDIQQHSKSFGLKLIQQFSKKLHASKSTFSFEQGTRYTLVFEV